MGCGRVALIGAVALASVGAVACGGGGRSLEAWAEEADLVCEDLADEIEGADADAAEGEVDDAVAALEDLDPPGGDDAEVAEDAISALEDGLSAQIELVADVGTGDDDFAAMADAVEGVDVDEEAEAVEDAGAGECVDVLEDGAVDTGDLEAAIELLPDVAALRVGDCVVLEPDVAEVDCDEAQAEVLKTELGEPTCPDEADVTQTFESSSGNQSATLGLCAVSLAPPAEADGFLEVGSCVNLVDAEEADTFTVREVGCGAADATHEILDGTNDPADCLADEEAFATSADEEAEFGVGTWCAAPL